MDTQVTNATAELLAPYILGAGLILVRLVALLLFVPGFGERDIPRRVRVILAIVLAVALDLALSVVAVPIPAEPLTLVLMVIRELIWGFGMGLVVHLIFASVSAAGAVASMKMGLGMSQFVDPASGENSLSLGALMGVAGALIFVTMDGHHVVIAALFSHLKRYPVGDVAFSLPSLPDMARAGSHLMTTAVLLAAPVIVVTLLTHAALGFVSRLVPSVNLFGIGLGLIILASIIALQQEGHAILRIMEREIEWLPDRMFRFAPGG